MADDVDDVDDDIGCSHHPANPLMTCFAPLAAHLDSRSTGTLAR